MINKRQFLTYAGAFFLMTGAFSCKKYLQVKPEDQFIEDTVYSSEISINNVVNGFYTKMAKVDLYGGNLSMTTVDLLAQYYNGSTFSAQAGWGTLSNYSYLEPFSMNKFSEIWKESYRTILNLNNFILKLSEVPENVLSTEKKSILLGEAYGLRAFLHFDLLRLYGPVYADNAGAKAIPYITQPTKDAQEISSASRVISYIIDDLKIAASKLDKDPVRIKGVEVISGKDPFKDFYTQRNRRMNYFAVQALQARVALYAGDKPAALSFATKVIGEIGGLFPWSAASLSLPGVGNPDRVFSSELLFGLENPNLYNAQRDYFNSALVDQSIFAPLPERLNAIYPSENDYRYRSSWILDQTGTKPFKTFFKFKEVSNKSSLVRWFQPLIRISELYYIAAEAETEPSRARTFLNTVRTNRGLLGISASDDLSVEITNEYQREFWGEGQTFFYFKRKKLASIPNGSTTNGSKTMSAKNYVVPLPLSETDNR